MRLLNDTPLQFGFVYFPVQPPQHSVTFVLKATFRLVPDGIAEPLPADDQPRPEGDILFDSDPALPCRSESDYAVFKPRADLLLAGSVYAPAGETRTHLAAGFQVGDWSKRLLAFGNRQWTEDPASATGATEPQPFSRIALRYENAYGGPGYAANPVGKGHRPLRFEDGSYQHPLPNIEIPDDRTTHSETPPGGPAGFGPVGRLWPQRRKLAGSYDGEWRARHWPYLPPDFDWGFYNAAPPDQQVDGYLRGDEAMRFENLDPNHPTLDCRLPGWRPRLFLAERQDGAEALREVTLHLDTLFADMDAGNVRLVWRGVAAVRSREFNEVEWAYVAREELNGAPLTLDHYTQRFAEERADEERPDETRERPVPPLTRKTKPAFQTLREPDPEIRKGLDMALDRLRQGRIDPDIIAALEPIDDPRLFADTLVEMMNVKVTPEQITALDDAQKTELRKRLADQGLDPGLVDRAQGAPAPQGSSEPAAPETASRSSVVMSRSRGEDFNGANLTGLGLSNLDLSDGVFREAVLKDADLSASILERADLVGANLSGARLIEARLAGADLTGADLSNADLTGADLTGTTLDRADLSDAILVGAVLTNAHAESAVFTNADLSDAIAIGALLERAELDGTVLDRAIFDGASLVRARMERAHGQLTSLAGAVIDGIKAGSELHLPGARFQGASGRKPLFSGANLDGADLSYADLPEADFSNASLRRANLEAVELSRATLRKACMPACTLHQANLFLAKLDGADLRKADLSQANLFGAGLFQANADGAILEGANIRKTLLALKHTEATR